MDTRIRWYVEDDIWYGWSAEQNMRRDGAMYFVKSVPRNADGTGGMIWAGWWDDNGEVQCMTHDYLSAHGACEELEAIYMSRVL